jgi:hypothetical protein
MERKVKRTERGWLGHFFCGRGHYVCVDKLRFRRNTLLELGEEKIVVSTVGDYVNSGVIETIGYSRTYYETKVFVACKDGKYIQANMSYELDVESKNSIQAESPDELPDDVYNIANMQHEAVVIEFIDEMENQKSQPQGF